MAADPRGTDAAAPAVSVIVPPEHCCGRADALRRALEAQTDEGFEVIEARCCFEDGATTGRRRVCVGPAVALNLAAARARGRLLAFLSPDLAPRSDWVAAVRRALEDPAGPEVVIGRTELPSGEFTAAAEAALDGSGDGPDCPTALHCALRRSAFERLGGFDESSPPVVLHCRPTGSLPVSDALPVADGMGARRTASGGVWQFVRGQFALGRAAYYAPPGRSLARRLADVLGAPARAARLVRRKWELAPVLALLPAGMAARMLGWMLGLLKGGRPGRAVGSPLVGPRSPHLVGPGEAGPEPVTSVVLPVLGCPDWLEVCLEALARQDLEEPYEVVAGAECTVAAQEELRRRFPGLHIVRCAAGGGPGTGRNAAIRLARGDYLAFTDDDCLPSRDWLRRLVTACRDRGGAPVRGWLRTAFPYSCLARALNAAPLSECPPSGPRPTRGLGGCNMCVARAHVERTGARFAERVYGAEEMVFLRELGGPEVLLEPRAVVRHLRTGGLRPSLARQYRLGWGSGWHRRRLDMRGSVFARHVCLAPMLAPLRFANLARRAVLRSPSALLEFVRLSPLLLGGYVFYAAGFTAGALAARREERRAPAPR